jgi:hypothetical protein
MVIDERLAHPVENIDLGTLDIDHHEGWRASVFPRDPVVESENVDLDARPVPEMMVLRAGKPKGRTTSRVAHGRRHNSDMGKTIELGVSRGPRRRLGMGLECIHLPSGANQTCGNGRVEADVGSEIVKNAAGFQVLSHERLFSHGPGSGLQFDATGGYPG